MPATGLQSPPLIDLTEAQNHSVANPGEDIADSPAQAHALLCPSNEEELCPELEMEATSESSMTFHLECSCNLQNVLVAWQAAEVMAIRCHVNALHSMLLMAAG